jgi:hypothetical protein
MTRTILVVALALRAVPAAAHGFAPALLELRETAGGVVMTWKPPLANPAALAPVLPAGCTLPGTAAGDVVQARLACRPGELAGATVGVDGLEATGSEALVRVVLADGREATAVLRAGAARFVVPRAPAAGDVALRWLRLGIGHILGGPDHLLLVLGLVLLVQSGRALVKTLTAFTVAHSATLALATADVLRVPQRPVEALIAASLVLVALELVRPAGAPPTLLATRPWLAAFALGLLHGLGFAGALADAGLPARHLALALVTFNGGVELGQLAFVAAVALPVRAVARRAWLRAVPAYAIGAVAVCWTLQRLGG